MAFQAFKPSFLTALDYVTNQQQHGNPMGGPMLLNRRFNYRQSLHRKDLYAHYGCVNAIEFSTDGEWMISGGDDKRVLIWNMSRTLTATPSSYLPQAMKTEHNSNIFCLAFNKSHSKIFSAGNDEQVILHDIATKEILDVFPHQEAVYGLSADPINDNLFASSCDDGRVLLWDTRQSNQDPIVLASHSSAYHAVMHNPVEPNYLATANAREGVCLRDIRYPSHNLIMYGSSLSTPSAMSVRFNMAGNQILALRRRFPPVLYNINSPHYIAEFDHPEYYNSCTMKSCCFAGDKDQYVLSGSDDFKLYMWKIPDKTSRKGIVVRKTHMVLRGHRSIVNQVRYNNAYGVIASSGVEKIIKLWSSFSLTNSEKNESEELRKVYSHEEYINLVLHSGQFMTHDYSHQSTREDPRMMAFFDSLVQRDIEGWTSDSNDSSINHEREGLYFEIRSSDESTSTFSSSSSDEELENIVEMNKKDPLYNCDIRPWCEPPCPHANNNIDEGTSANDGSANNQTVESSLSNDSPLVESPVNRAPTRRDNATDRLLANTEGGASRRLFSDRDTGAGSRILSDTDGVMGRYLSGRDGATSRLFTDREEAANYLLNSRQNTTNNLNNDKSHGSKNLDGDEDFHPSSDRISQLIAEKRRVRKLKLARKSMKKDNILHRKNKRRGKNVGNKHCIIKPAVNNQMGFIPLNIDNSNQPAQDCLDKIKQLRRKRARLSKDPTLDGNSSDSEDESENSVVINEDLKILNSPPNVSNGNKRKIKECDSSSSKINSLFRCRNSRTKSDDSVENKTQEKCVSSVNTNGDSGSLCTASNEIDHLESDKNPSCFNNCDKPNNGESTSLSSDKLPFSDGNLDTSHNSYLDNSTNTSENENSQKEQNGASEINESNSASISQSNADLSITQTLASGENSDSPSCFPVSVVKFARNYRKRSVEDPNDD